MSGTDSVQSAAVPASIPAAARATLAQRFAAGKQELAEIGAERQVASASSKTGFLSAVGGLTASGIVVGVATQVASAAAVVGVGASLAAAAVPAALVAGAAAVTYGVYKFAKGHFAGSALDERADTIGVRLGVDPSQHTVDSYLGAVSELEPHVSGGSWGPRRHEVGGLLHREDGPALERNDGTREWYRYGELHREDGPAIDRSDGSYEWRRNGALHREDGPAFKDTTTERWYLNGEAHRDGGPSKISSNGDLEWSQHGEMTAYYDASRSTLEHYQDRELHRDDGPARVRFRGDDVVAHSWYRGGQPHYPSGLPFDVSTGAKLADHARFGPGPDPCGPSGAGGPQCEGTLYPFTREGAAQLPGARPVDTSMYEGKVWVDGSGRPLDVQPEPFRGGEQRDAPGSDSPAERSNASASFDGKEPLEERLGAVARERAQAKMSLASLEPGLGASQGVNGRASATESGPGGRGDAGVSGLGRSALPSRGRVPLVDTAVRPASQEVSTSRARSGVSFER